MREAPNIHNSEALNDSNKEYVNSIEYKMKLSERIDTLKWIWIFPEFAEALAKDSINYNIMVSELLWAEDEIKSEDKKLRSQFSYLENEKVNRVLN